MTSEVPVLEPVGASSDAPRQLSRPLGRGWVGGVSAGIAEHIGAAPIVIRAAFVLLASWKLIGIAAYFLCWLVIPRETAAPRAPGLDAHTRRGLRTASENSTRRADVGQALALALLGGGLFWFIQAQGWGLSGEWLLVVGLVSFGITLAWCQADRASLSTAARGVGWRRWVAPLLTHWTTVLALSVGLLCVGVAVGLGVAMIPGLGATTTILVAIIIAAIALLVLAGPFIMRGQEALAQAREEKLVADARADVAAHLHDSVLQTLALIQRQATDQRAVVRLARRQERELRQWLYGSSEMPDTLEAALIEEAQEIEDDFPVSVECVVVGDADLTAPLLELVKAAREAMMNAAKHSGSPLIDVYAEVGEDTVEVFVRDRGRGFDPAQIADDRQGVRGSILDRMERHGGTAHIRSHPDRGTEVSLEMKR